MPSLRKQLYAFLFFVALVTIAISYDAYFPTEIAALPTPKWQRSQALDANFMIPPHSYPYSSPVAMATATVPSLVEHLLHKSYSEYLLDKNAPTYMFLAKEDFTKKFNSFVYPYAKKQSDAIAAQSAGPTGFVDPISDYILIAQNPGYDFPHYLAISTHEALHYYSRSNGQQEFLPFYIEEGLTEYFRQKAFNSSYGDSDIGIKYVGWQNQKEIIDYLAEKIPQDDLRDIYFRQGAGKFDAVFNKYFPNTDIKEFRRLNEDLGGLFDVEVEKSKNIKDAIKELLV